MGDSERTRRQWWVRLALVPVSENLMRHGSDRAPASPAGVRDSAERGSGRAI